MNYLIKVRNSNNKMPDHGIIEQRCLEKHQKITNKLNTF